MDTLKAERTRTRIAWIAFLVAISCLAMYIMACVISPPAWSPDSSKIAILVTPHEEEPDKFALFTYDVAAGTHTLLDEMRADGILSAPSWSPNGKWIAYYKVEHPAKEEPRSGADVAEPNQLPAKADVPIGPEGTADSVAELFGEDNLMLPSFLWEVLEERSEDMEDLEVLDVKLVLVSPDGGDRRVLGTMKWIGDEEVRSALMYMRPVWSPDCERLFYVRAIEDILCVSSMELATGETRTHTFSSIGIPVLSHDGQWVASYMEDADALVVARIDGGLTKYFRLPFEVDGESLWMTDGISWSTDTNRLFVVAEDTTLHAVDLATGTTEEIIAPDPNHRHAYFTQSPGRDRLYFIAGVEAEEETSEEQTFTLKYVNLDDKRTGRVFEFQIPEISDDEMGGRLSISPDGRTILARGLVMGEFEQAKSALIFLDGKTKKIVNTDRWLLKPLYSDADLISEDRLIGQWSGEDGQVSIAKGTREKTYRLTWTEDEEEHHAGVSVVQIKGLTFLALFFDESVLEKENASDSHLLPDGFARVVQVEPKLIFQGIEYDELARALKEASESLRPEDLGDNDLSEFVRVRR